MDALGIPFHVGLKGSQGVGVAPGFAVSLGQPEQQCVLSRELIGLRVALYGLVESTEIMRLMCLLDQASGLGIERLGLKRICVARSDQDRYR
jgi:hypothetical protein